MPHLVSVGLTAFCGGPDTHMVLARDYAPPTDLCLAGNSPGLLCKPTVFMKPPKPQSILLPKTGTISAM